MRETYSVFISMPFGPNPEMETNRWTRIYVHAIKRCEELARADRQLSRRINVSRADSNLRALGLKENVRFHIDACDFVICVLTVEKGENLIANPNLLWEIGYAEAKGRPIVFLSNDECIRQLPALVGSDNLLCLFDLREFNADKSSEEVEKSGAKVAMDLWPFIRAAIWTLEERQPGRRGRYEVMAYSDRRHVQMPEFLSAAQSSIDILTTNLSYFCNEANSIEKALQKGVRVRIATLDPDCHIAEYRAKQLGLTGDVGLYREELRNAMVSLYFAFEKHYGDQFRMVVYEDLPLQITVRVDNEVVTSLVTHGKRSRDRIHVRFRVEDEGVFDTFVSHFQTVFDRARDIMEFSWIYREKQKRILKGEGRGG